MKVRCLWCFQVFPRPSQLELWEAAPYCAKCKGDMPQRVERRLVRAQRELGAVQLLSPLLTDVEKPVERRPGEKGWARAEAGG